MTGISCNSFQKQDHTSYTLIKQSVFSTKDNSIPFLKGCSLKREMFFTLLWCIIEWGIYGTQMYFAWSKTVKLISYCSNVAWDFSKSSSAASLPIIMYNRWF